MAENLFVATVIGNLGRDAATNTLPPSKVVTETSLAINGTKADGTKIVIVKWVKVQIWGNRSDALASHLQAGKLMFFEGTPDVDAWTTEEGKLRSQVVLNVNPNDRIRFLTNGAKAADTEEVAEDHIPF